MEFRFDYDVIEQSASLSTKLRPKVCSILV